METTSLKCFKCVLNTHSIKVSDRHVCAAIMQLNWQSDFFLFSFAADLIGCCLGSKIKKQAQGENRKIRGFF